MPTQIHSSFLSGTIGGVGYRGLLSADLTDTAFVVSLLGATLVTVPVSTIQAVRVGQMPSDFGIKVTYTSDNQSRLVHLRTLDVAWVRGFQDLGIPVIETPVKAFDMQYFLPMVLFVLLAAGIFVIYFFIVLR